MQKRFLTITIVSSLLFLVAVGGYLIPASGDEPPVRVLLENKGGKILFNHANHTLTMNEECGTCHHTTGNAQNPPACSSCHVAKFDEAFTAAHQTELDEQQCASCHHAKATIDNFSHDDHEMDYADGDCQTCHHDESIAPEPQACSNCHIDGSNSVLNIKDASHVRCADSGCHDDFFEAGSKGCFNCHTRKTTIAPDAEKQACSSCHETPIDQLVPTSMSAFHAKCMGCHESEGAGPFGDKACYQCHMK